MVLNYPYFSFLQYALNFYRNVFCTFSQHCLNSISVIIAYLSKYWLQNFLLSHNRTSAHWKWFLFAHRAEQKSIILFCVNTKLFGRENLIWLQKKKCEILSFDYYFRLTQNPAHNSIHFFPRCKQISVFVYHNLYMLYLQINVSDYRFLYFLLFFFYRSQSNVIFAK